YRRGARGVCHRWEAAVSSGGALDHAGERDRARPESGRSASGAVGTETDCLTPANEATSDFPILDFSVVTTEVFPGRRLAGARRHTPGELPRSRMPPR